MNLGIVSCTLALGLLASQAMAASCTATAVDVAFGRISTLSSAEQNTNGTVTVTCRSTVVETVSFSLGLSTGYSGTYLHRHMQTNNGPGFAYQLYLDPARTLVWGDGTGGTQVLRGSMTLRANTVRQDFAVYGRVFGHQKFPVGTFADNLTLLLNY